MIDQATRGAEAAGRLGLLSACWLTLRLLPVMMQPAVQCVAGRTHWARRGGMAMLGRLLLLLLPPPAAYGSVPFDTHHRNFGSVIRGAPLPPTGAVAFEHKCSATPCAVTQILFASVYPAAGAAFDWQHATISLFIDGETDASVSVSALELGWTSDFASRPSVFPSGAMYDNSGRGWGNEYFGHTAVSGGTYSTLRVPFARSLRVLVRPAPGTTTESRYWFDVRGVEALPIILGELELPPAARLKIHRVSNRSLAHLEMLTIASAPAGMSGAILGTKFDATSADFTYLEACPRFYRTAAPDEPPMYLASGAEDYFLSANYFDAGTFVTPESGLTFKDATGGIGAFKMHTRDLLLFHDGMRLVWRNGDTGCQGCQPGNSTGAPCAYCPGSPPQTPPPVSSVAAASVPTIDRVQKTNDSCYAMGPIAYGFDRPGGDGSIVGMMLANHSGGGDGRCTAATIDAPGCRPEDCARACCDDSSCNAWVHAAAPGCAHGTGTGSGADVCCWHKQRETQLQNMTKERYPQRYNPTISTGVVSGHASGLAPPPPPPAPPCSAPNPQGTACRCGPDGACPRAPPRAEAGHALYSTLVYYYVWPTTARGSPVANEAGDGMLDSGDARGGFTGGLGEKSDSTRLVDALERLAALLARGVLTPAEFQQAKQRVLEH